MARHKRTLESLIQQAEAEQALMKPPKPKRIRNDPKPPRAGAPTHVGTLTAIQAAEQMGTTVKTIHRYIHQGKIQAVKPGGARLGWRIPLSEIDRLMGTPGLDRMKLLTGRQGVAKVQAMNGSGTDSQA